MREKYDETWYNNLKKPNFQPPATVFAPVWTILYILMAISFIIVIFAPYKPFNIIAYLLFLLQLTANLLWPVVFFKEHNLLKAFVLCFLLTILVFLTMIAFFFISKTASVLLLPYLLWCGFATRISFEVWELNSD